MKTRAQFMEEVAEAALRFQKRRRRLRSVSENSLRALDEARAEDPLRGVKAARRAPRCTKIRTNGKPCRAPAIKGVELCRWHGGLRRRPDHIGNVRRFLDGTYARQSAYKIRMKPMNKHWRQLDPLRQQYLRELLRPDEWSDMAFVDFAAECLIETKENFSAWTHFLKQLDARRNFERRRQSSD
jgi:hypothetical protein